VLDETEFYVDALPLDHSIFCLGWRLQEKTRAGIFNLEEAQALGIPRGPMYGKLQDGESVTLPDGRVIKPEMVLGAPRPGKSVVYCLDTQFSERSIELAENCTALIHETTFSPDDVELARDRKHSTMEDAARVAKAAGAGQLIATHFSSRYDGRQVLKMGDDARSIFENLTVGRDLLEVEI
jgi:ribonuclease Z